MSHMNWIFAFLHVDYIQSSVIFSCGSREIFFPSSLLPSSPSINTTRTKAHTKPQQWTFTVVGVFLFFHSLQLLRQRLRQCVHFLFSFFSLHKMDQKWMMLLCAFSSSLLKPRWKITGLSVHRRVQVKYALCLISQEVWSQTDNFWQFIHFPFTTFSRYTHPTQHITTRV